MLQVTGSQVRLGLTAADKDDAIRTAGRLMVDCGLIEPGYVDSMLGRERVAATYLGSGIAIPHGLPEARHLVRRTGVVVVQFPGGVDWGAGEPARLVVGIAAKSDEHIAVLQRLTGVLGNPAEAERLGTTDDAGAVVAALNGAAPPPPAADPAPAPAGGGDALAVTAPAPHGLHARPATVLVEVAKRFEAEIAVRHGNGVANARSLVSLLRLGVSGGQPLTITASGPDAGAALTAIREAFATGLGEPPAGAAAAPPSPTAAPRPDPAAVTDYEGQAIVGISASPGVAVGPVWIFQREELTVAETARDPDAEHRRLDRALATAGADLRTLHESFWKKAGAARAAIFKAHMELLDDPEMVTDAHARIDAGAAAGHAWRGVYEERAATLAQLADPLLAGRAADLRDVGRRVLRLLADRAETTAPLPDHPVILLAEDLEPSDTAKLDPARVLGLCTAGGGATSHTAIIARSLDIPAVVAAGPAVLDQRNGTEAIINGDDGVLVVEPGDRDRQRAATARTAVEERRTAERLDRYKPAITTDGKRVEVAANISDPAEAGAAVDAGAEGIGLMRTEFLFLQRESPPDEEEQTDAYRAMVRAMNGLPIILRTLDIGGDKNVPYLRLPAEANPFLGVRGIRLCFEREDLFRTQLRAMLRASADGPVRIMYPMIATPDELARARAITEEVRRETGAAPVELGIMVEVPSAVMMADQLARAVDFFSIGTNDLTQYVLAMDRLHPVLAPQADGLHPAVLRMVERTVAAARDAGIWVGACGGIAGDPAGAILLAGLGVSELSVAIPAVASVKARLRGISMAEAEAAAAQALACADAAAVRALVRDRFTHTGDRP
ncbi:phosphoenolpyruvate--protein phosphotransferase [Azospirillum halopraeferens]|uniref:phosphoenolpyruvate--protein phosphotransferase n=1 Tax=Azospirillum halopraeferens TaxID=34010 RepID=UPI0003FC8D47|nr:phosphoenolpyruvate--protein phosphotransferase [Azospirillum halopraeferens]